MRQARVYGLVGLAALAAAAVAFAQTTVTPVPDQAPVETAPLATAKASWGDAKAGQAKAGTCAACHGLDGNPTDLQYPRLAGQSERYIAKQLALFKNGERTGGMSAVMVPFAQMLSAQDMRDLGAYFATQNGGAGIADDTVIATGPNAGKKFFEVGQTLFLAGDKARGIPSCMACHGPAGAGNPGPAYPAIGGQPASYVQRRLEEYRTGTTAEKDAAHFKMMATIAKPLTDEEIGSLASYIQGLHPRPRNVDMTATAPVPAAAPAPAPATTPAATDAEAEAGSSSRPLGG